MNEPTKGKMTTAEIVCAIVKSSQDEGSDPVANVQDYYAEKDSHFNRARIEWIIKQYCKTENAQ